MVSLYFEILRARRGVLRRKQWFFRIVSSNGNILCHSESYYNLEDVYSAIELIKNGAESAEITLKEYK